MYTKERNSQTKEELQVQESYQKGMEHSIEITPIDDQILPQTENDEIEEGRKVDHLIEIPKTNGQDLLGSQTKKSINQFFDKKFKDLDNSSIKSCNIFKVTAGLRDSNPDAYKPKIVSIGPYHRKNRQLRPMERYKLLYLRRFLQRKEGLDVESCISKLEKLKEKALKCYDGIEDLSNDTGQLFLQMLLLDGCFVVEFIRELHGMCPQGEDKIINTNVGCISEQVQRDLLLLENQLPFFVLNKLHHMTEQDSGLPFTILAKCIFPINLPNMTSGSFLEIYSNANAGNIKHLLHLVHMSWQGNSNTNAASSWKSLCCNPLKIIKSKEKPKANTEFNLDNYKVMPNATELSEAGVSFTSVGYIFESRMDKTSSFEMKFENGEMKIPCLRVFDNTESNLRNLIAYEQQSSDVQTKYFSDYATFMDFLIDSDKDVNLLRRKGIIENWIGEDKEVASLFNKIGNGVTIYTEFYYKEECRKAFEHCKKPWNKMKANLRHNYFSSPWAGAATVGAIILLILTTMQTVLAFTGGLSK